MLLRPGFIPARVYASPKTDREVASRLGSLVRVTPENDKKSGKLTVKYSGIDPGQDSPVLCLRKGFRVPSRCEFFVLLLRPSGSQD